MGLLCMLFPAAFFCRVRNRILGIQYENTINGLLKLIFEYLCGNALINTVVILLRMVVSHAAGNVFELLNRYNDFAVKYLILAVALAYLLPYMEMALYKNWDFDYEFNIKACYKKLSDRSKRNIVLVYGTAMALHHLIRVFDNCFWGDEGIVVNAARRPWGDMLKYVAWKGHSPFHYAFAWMCVKVFGESGFLFHLSATLPYFIIVFLSVTLVRKWFGNKVSIIFVTLSTLLESAVVYNLEVRMYAWCQLFIFSVYLILYRLLKTKKDMYYLPMMICSLGAVYSHYFAIAGIGMMYLILLFYVAATKPRNMWKVFISGSLVLFLLLPWLIFAKKTRGVIMSDYNIGLVGWYECFEFIFHSKYSTVLLILFFMTLLFRLAYDLGIIEIKTGQEQRKTFFLGFDLGKIHLDREWIWIIAGLAAVFGTITISEMISELVYPIVVLRYLYPSFVIIWFLFSVSISRCKFGRMWTVLLISFIFITCYPAYFNILKGERENNKRLESTLKATVSEIDENDFIYTNIIPFDWTVSEVYYPNIPHELFGHPERWGPVRLPELNENTNYWLFLYTPISEEIVADLRNMEYEPELIVNKGFIGTGDVWIYKVVSKVE